MHACPHRHLRAHTCAHKHMCTLNSVRRGVCFAPTLIFHGVGNTDYFPNPSISPLPLIQVYSSIFSFWFLYHLIKSHFFFCLLTYFWRISED